MVHQVYTLETDFEAVYVKFYPRMLRFAAEYISSEEDSENIVQDIFTTLWERKSVITVRTSIETYLFNLTKNRCIDFLRHNVVADDYKSEQYLMLKALQLLPDRDTTEEEIERIVDDAIRKLPPRCREIFMKSRFEGKKYREIAAELHLSESTVETQMGIALRKLRGKLKDFMPIFLFFC